MSNYLAMAAVTESLRLRLYNAVRDIIPGSEVKVTNLIPKEGEPGLPAVGVNLYLFQIMPNTANSNIDLPTRRQDGSLAQRPRRAFDLHFVLTFFGDDTKLEPQRLLGCVLRTLHVQPVLTREQITDAIESNSALDGTLGPRSDLDQEVEKVIMDNLPLSSEELYFLWQGFQNTYHLSVGYKARAVFVDSEITPSVTLPVLTRNIYVRPFKYPFIDRVIAQAGASVLIEPGASVEIQGKDLKGDSTLVRLGTLEITPTLVQEKIVRFSLPTSLRAGLQGVQVKQNILMGSPLTAHTGFHSNIASFVLHPRVVSVLFTAPSTVTVTVSPTVAKEQKVTLLINQNSLTPAAYSFEAEERTADATVMIFKIQDVNPGSYFVRIQVDGAESGLAVNSQGQFTGPLVVIT